MKKHNKRKYDCYKCNTSFVSWQQRDAHLTDAHKPPEVYVEEVIRYGEEHSLLNANHVKIGDTISFTKRGVVTKTTTVEGSTTVKVEVAVIADSYSRL